MLTAAMLGPLNNEQKTAVDVIMKNAVSLNGLINDIMDIRKLDIDKIKFNIEPISLGTFLATVNTSYGKILSDKGIKFITKFPTIDRVIRTDSQRLRQVLDNLIGNAIKFMPQDNGMIELTTIEDQQNLIICVKDNGRGIPKDKQQNLFQKFYQIDTSERRSSDGGTGLGLAISKGIIENLGGIITMESDGSTGSAFYIKFPLGEI